MLADRQRKDATAGRLSLTLSIRARLMLLAAIAVLPLLLDRAFDIHAERSERIEAASQQALVLAKQGMAAQNEAIVSARAVLDVVASAQALMTTRGDRCDTLLEEVAAKAPWLKAISVATPAGTIFCSSRVNSVGLDISKFLHFKRAVETGEFALTDYTVGARSGAAIFVALPHHAPNGSIDAIVTGVLELSWFGRVASALAQSSGSVVLMVDGSGTVLARQPGEVGWVGRQIKDDPMVSAMLATSEGTFTGVSLDGVRRIFGFVQLPGTSTHLAVGFDESEVLQRVTRETITAFSGLGLLTVLVLIGIWFGGQRLFVEPIRVLTRTAQQFGRGEFKARAATLPWAAEFVPLAAALDDMAGQIAIREQQLRDSNGQLQELVNVDGLTGIANRRSFNARLAEDWQRAAKLRDPIALLMIDVDHFKAFNDHYGHAQGDVCLRNVSYLLTSNSRTHADPPDAPPGAMMPPSFRMFAGRHPDFVTRYGGEEFAVLLQGASVDEAMKAAERLRRAVEEARVIHEASPRGIVTISVGVASLVPEEGQSAHQLVDAADASLYEAKRRGRNRALAHPVVTLREVG